MTVVFGASPSQIKKFGTSKLMFVGRNRENEDFFIDSIKPHVIFICGARGSGKSYTMGVLIEELAEKNDAVASIVVDPIGVFWSMRSPNKIDREIETLGEWNLEPKGFENVRVLVPVGAKNLPTQSFQGFFSLKPSELTASDWTFAFGIERFSPGGLLVDNAIQKLGSDYDIDDLVRVIDTDTDLQSKDRGFSKQTRRGLISRLESAKYWGIFGDKPTALEHIAQCGKVTILDVSFLEEAVASLVVGIISRKILERRKIESRNEALGQRSSFPPVWLFIDEAHTLIPKDRKTAASDSLIEYVKQGRKPGCSIVLATQQPSSINSDVLSQLDMMFVHQLVFADDIKAVSKRMPAAMPHEWDLNFIRGLRVGESISGDRETTSVSYMTARPRKSQHEGRSTLAIERPKVNAESAEVKEVEVKPEEKEPEKVKSEKSGGRRIPLVKSGMEIEDAEKIASKFTEKGLFRRRSRFDVKMKVYWPFWFVKGVGVEGNVEFLFDGIFGEIEGSKGLQRMLDLSPLAARIMSREGTLEQISRNCGADQKMVKLQLNKLVNLGLVRVKGKEDRIYSPRLFFPTKVKEFDGSIDESSPEGRMMKPIFDPDKKVFHLLGVKPVEKELVYVPFGLFRTEDREQVWVNLSTGEVEKRKIKLRI